MKDNLKEKGISLLKKSKKSIISAVFSRMGLIVLLLLVQVVLFGYLFRRFEDFLPQIYSVMVVFSGFMALYLLNSRSDASAKLTWLLVIVLLPAFGALFYLYTQMDVGHRALKDRTQYLSDRTKGLIPPKAGGCRASGADRSRRRSAGKVYHPQRLFPRL